MGVDDDAAAVPHAEADGTLNIGPYCLDTIYHGDARHLAPAIPDASVDLIFTDPPYLREYIPLYGWLSREAVRMLKPDGMLLAYVGTYHQDAVMALMREHMEFFWAFVAMGEGMGPINWQRRIICRHKMIIAYRKPGALALPRYNALSVWRGSGQDKRYHTWGQDESTARYYIDVFSKAGDVVLDPFIGGGTTAAICRVLGRHYLGFEIDPAMADVARRRVEETQMPLIELMAEQTAMAL